MRKMQSNIFICICFKKTSTRTYTRFVSTIISHEKLSCISFHSDKPFSCDFCGSRFSQWGNLRHHIQRHLGISPYACPYCKKTFIAPCKLEVHIRGHLDERPYVCDRCQATFRCNDDLRKHLIIHADYKVNISLSFHSIQLPLVNFSHSFVGCVRNLSSMHQNYVCI